MQDKAAVSEEKAIARRMAERLLEGSEDKINRNIKDSVFCDLFGKKEYLLQLYKVLHPEDAETEEDDLTIVTLSRIFVREMYNDLGFMAGNKLIVLVEAQSSWSENITVRFLMYLGETYRRYIERNHLELYGTRRIPLPKPELYMVFTGERADRPERISLKRTFWETDECCVEVTAHVIYDSREGDILNQFIVFSRVFDEQRKLYPNDARKAVRETIRICRSRDVLARYLEQEEAAAIMFEFADQEREFNLALAAEREEGRTQGIEEGIARGITQGLSEGKILGIIETMREDGRSDEDIIARLVSRCGLPEEQAEEYLKETEKE